MRVAGNRHMPFAISMPATVKELSAFLPNLGKKLLRRCAHVTPLSRAITCPSSTEVADRARGCEQHHDMQRRAIISEFAHEKILKYILMQNVGYDDSQQPCVVPDDPRQA